MLQCVKKTILLACALLLAACHGHTDKNTLRVGTIAGPDSALMEVAKQVAKNKYNLNVEIVEFTDFVEPNAALNDGSIDANMFQHQPYLNRQNQDRHYTLQAVGKTFVFPMGIYSQKMKSLSDLTDGAFVAIPNDPSNEARALLLLQKAELIRLKNSTALDATLADIIDNPKHLKFKELDAAQIARSLPDVDIAVINSNYAITAGLSPAKDAIIIEDSNSPYANVIVVRQDEIHDQRIEELVSAVQSPEVLSAAKEIFNDQAIPAWIPAS